MKNYKSVLLLFVCAVALYFGIYFPNKITEKENLYNQLSKATTTMQRERDFYCLNFELNSEMTGMYAPNVIFKGTKANEKGSCLSNVVQGKPLLIFRYADVNCTTCYETELEALHSEFTDNTEFVIVLCSFMVDQEFVTLKRVKHIKLPIYHIAYDAFDWKLEDYASPYYFILHPDMKISHVYVPNKSYPELNKQYLEGVKRFLTE